MLYTQEVEQQERAEAVGESTASKMLKMGKVGKVKSKKAFEDTRPSPMGRRVQPRIDSAMKLRAEKAEAAKKTKAAKVRKLLACFQPLIDWTLFYSRFCLFHGGGGREGSMDTKVSAL